MYQYDEKATAPNDRGTSASPAKPASIQKAALERHVKSTHLYHFPNSAMAVFLPCLGGMSRTDLITLPERAPEEKGLARGLRGV